nr:UPF0481 protein At3g47200-like [Ipomoea batatas]
MCLYVHQKEEGECTVDIKEENQNQEAGKHIPRVSSALVKAKPDAYKPKLISIGPYHMEDPDLEKQVKQEFQKSLFKNNGFKEQSTKRLTELKDKARSWYATDDETLKMKDEEFVNMLLLDACFILEFLDKYSKNEGLLQDLIVLVRKCIATRVPKLTPSNVKAARDYKPLPKHLVEVVHNLCIPRKAICGRYRECNDYGGIIEKMNSAAVLEEEGVGFKKIGKVYERYFEEKEGVKTFNATDRTTLFDLDFSNLVLRIPSFKIDNHTETFLANMIAYEQQSTEAAVWFSDYVSIMNQLIKSTEDVNMLCRRGIIVNCVDSNEMVNQMFSNLCQNVKTYNTFSGLITKINLHHDNAWSMWCGKLKQDLVYSPWKPISAVVGGLIVAVGSLSGHSQASDMSRVVAAEIDSLGITEQIHN